MVDAVEYSELQVCDSGRMFHARYNVSFTFPGSAWARCQIKDVMVLSASEQFQNTVAYFRAIG